MTSGTSRNAATPTRLGNRNGTATANCLAPRRSASRIGASARRSRAFPHDQFRPWPGPVRGSGAHLLPEQGERRPAEFAEVKPDRGPVSYTHLRAHELGMISYA